MSDSAAPAGQQGASSQNAPQEGSVAPPARRLGLVKTVGVLGILAGILMIVLGTVAYVAVSNELAAEKITVSDDAAAFAGQAVTGPFTAYAQAEVIQKHALASSGGKTYAQLSSDDPARQTMMTASFLRASLFTSVVAFGVAALVVGLGILFILFGWALHRLASAPVVVKSSAMAP
jgi:hypothetical protein